MPTTPANKTTTNQGFLPFYIPDISEADIEAVVAVLRSGWITTGEVTQRFEENFARYVGMPHALAVNSCTAALHLALEALGVKAGDEVIVPTMTFTATAEVVSYLGATPLLVDCQQDTLNIDPLKIEAAITPKTRAIIVVHFAGIPCEMDTICKIARDHGIYVIEDSAHALPAHYKGRSVGTLSDIACFSFYATKTITTAEGGMVVTANPEWAARMRMMSLHGISRDAWKRFSAEGSWKYEVMEQGFKYNLTDMASALGDSQLARATQLLQRRRELAQRYQDGLSNLSAIDLPTVPAEVVSSWHLYIIRLRAGEAAQPGLISRSEFIEQLRERGIGASVHYIPLHLHPYYARTFAYKPSDFPIASGVYEQIISLPLYSAMRDEDVDRVITAVHEILQVSSGA